MEEGAEIERCGVLGYGCGATYPVSCGIRSSVPLSVRTANRRRSLPGAAGTDSLANYGELRNNGRWAMTSSASILVSLEANHASHRCGTTPDSGPLWAKLEFAPACQLDPGTRAGMP